MKLFGPAPFDPLSLDRAARDLLSAWRADRAAMAEGTGADAGLYLIADDEGALRGFWLTFGERWLDEGVVGGRTPPFARALLEAATEELWWEGLAVAPWVLDAWRPVVVMEWPAFLADRSMMPPPGQPAEDTADDDGLDLPSVGPRASAGAGWIDPTAVEDDRTDERPWSPDAPVDPWADLPPQRGLVSIVRGSLRRRRGVHEGRFELVCLRPPDEEGFGVAAMPASWRRGLPPDEWLAEAATGASEPPLHPTLGYPLRLPGVDRVAFPVTGWLTRDLDVQPSSPRDAVRGTLVPRDTRNPLFAQIALAAAVTSALLLGALGFAQVSARLSEPRREVAAQPRATAAQPAISVCSPDHDGFVEALRCQVKARADGVAADAVSCADGVDPALDLQAAWCGLRRRDAGTTPEGAAIPLSAVAASQACFDVLGRPYRYEDPAARAGRADPVAMLYDGLLRVDAVVAVVEALDRACDVYEPRLEAHVSGGVLAAHVGLPADTPSDIDTLSELLFHVAEQDLAGLDRRAASRCLRSGARDGVDAPSALDDLCGAGLPRAPEPDDGAWARLGGVVSASRPGAPSVVERYLGARFGVAPASPADLEARPPLWACHDFLSRNRARDPAQGQWQLSMPSPQAYGEPTVSSQLRLDAWLRVLREDRRAGDACWREVDRLLSGYAPVHPLRSDPAAAGWPSEEQRVCGDVCAVTYKVEGDPGARWVTRGTDLVTCLDDTAPPREGLELVGATVLDRLRMPWNGVDWVAPEPDALCAFNLVAQGRLDGVLPDDRSGPEWSGELVAGRRIAGGEGGSAVRAARALATFGSKRSVATCSDVAAQCFVESLFDVVTDDRVAPLDWRRAWQDEIAGLPEQLADARRARGDSGRPWCDLVLPYLHADGNLPEGELDLPCALGVSEAMARVDRLAGTLAKQQYAEAAP